MPRRGQPCQAGPQSSGNEQSKSAGSRRKPPLVMVRGPGMVLSDELFQLRLALGPRRYVKGGTPSKRVLLLYGRPGGLCVCLNCEDEEEGLERARPIVAEAVAAGRIASNSVAALERWVGDRRQAGQGKVETLRTERPRVDSAEVMAEVKRLAALAPANYQVEMVAAARRLGQAPSILDSIVKSARNKRHRLKPAPRFMQWARGPGGKRVLQCAVYLSDGSRLSSGLKTDDTEVAGPRMRLLLWHAIAKGQLPRGVKHRAWALYGGPIPQPTKRLLRRLAALPWGEYELQRTASAQRLGYKASTIDWLTNQDNGRQADPVRRARARTLARSRDRKVGRRTPMSRSWQFGAVGGMLAAHTDGLFYAQLTIAGFTLRWPLAVRNRAEGEALLKPAVEARARVREAARDWRERLVGSPEAKTALTVVLAEQRRFRDALLAVGAKPSKRWPEVVKALNEPPFDETSRPDLEGCTRWFVELLQKNPERPPPGRPVEMLLEEADALFCVGGRGARRCYHFAQDKTGNRNWSTTRRPRKSAS
jgi:hypothetical protein